MISKQPSAHSRTPDPASTERLFSMRMPATAGMRRHHTVF